MSKLSEYQYSYVKSFRTNLVQKNTLRKLKNKYNIDISNFMRLAIHEKIKRDYPLLIEKVRRTDCPF